MRSVVAPMAAVAYTPCSSCAGSGIFIRCWSVTQYDMFFSRSSVLSSSSSADSWSMDSELLNATLGEDSFCLNTPECVARATCSDASLVFLLSVFSRYASVWRRCSTPSSASLSRVHCSFWKTRLAMVLSAAFTKHTFT